MRSFTAHGLYALMQLAQSTEGVDQASQSVAKGIELQSSEFDKFRATDPAESTLSASWLRAVSRGGHRGCDAPRGRPGNGALNGIPVTVTATAT